MEAFSTIPVEHWAFVVEEVARFDDIIKIRKMKNKLKKYELTFWRSSSADPEYPYHFAIHHSALDEEYVAVADQVPSHAAAAVVAAAAAVVAAVAAPYSFPYSPAAYLPAAASAVADTSAAYSAYSAIQLQPPQPPAAALIAAALLETERQLFDDAVDAATIEQLLPLHYSALMNQEVVAAVAVVHFQN